MQEGAVHSLGYESPRPRKRQPLNTGDAWMLALASGLLAGGLGAALDPNMLGAGPILMGIGGFLLGAVLPVRFWRDESR